MQECLNSIMIISYGTTIKYDRKVNNLNVVGTVNTSSSFSIPKKVIGSSAVYLNAKYAIVEKMQQSI